MFSGGHTILKGKEIEINGETTIGLGTLFEIQPKP
jgi:hypothetical protein